MSEYKLHCFKESGNTYKAALMLELCGADWEAVWVDYFNGATRTDSYRETLNEMGEAPVLFHGDKCLTQSGAILQYISDRFGRFGASNEDESYEILRWLLFDNHKLTSYTGTYRFLVRWAGGVDPAVKDFFHGRMLGAYGVLEKRLADRPFVIGNEPTIADISMCGYLFWLNEVGEDPADWPNITAWLDRIRALPGWVDPYELLPNG